MVLSLLRLVQQSADTSQHVTRTKVFYRTSSVPVETSSTHPEELRQDSGLLLAESPQDVHLEQFQESYIG